MTTRSINDNVRHFQEWRRRNEVDRFVTTASGENPLLLDLDDGRCIQIFLKRLRRASERELRELFPPPEQVPFRGAEGRYAHEIVVPIEVKPRARSGMTPSVATKKRIATLIDDTAHVDRQFAPGSEWLYLKVYTGQVTADRLLLGVLGPQLEEMLGAKLINSYFFIRYADPRFHVRLRLAGSPDALLSRVLPRLRDHLQPEIRKHAVASIVVDSYERETERYGGVSSIELAEAIFFHDSRAVLRALRVLGDDMNGDTRWQAALVGIDRLLQDFGLVGPDQIAILHGLVDGPPAHRLFLRDKNTRKSLARKFREHRNILQELLFESTRVPGALETCFADRSSEVRPLATSYLAAQENGKLSTDMNGIIASFVHMFVNRFLRSAHREQEFVLYDLLLQARKAQRARGLQHPQRKSPPGDRPTLKEA